ncbi:MAG TPA: F0F1 ATP synthase subunit A [Aggregatilineales bacterium]|nr:F0F1 ATP synthase subunit A [Aggregatilineales bacterium]
MNATTRGLLIFAGVVAFLAACAFITFVFLPSQGSGATLPVIVVPGEPYDDKVNFLGISGMATTNTWVATLLATAIVYIVAFLAWRTSKGWTNEVPGRFQAIIELLGEFVYGQVKNFAGTVALARNWLFPLAASIFFFLLVANWMKLLPGVETIGLMHCAGGSYPEYGFSITAGHPAKSSLFGNQLNITEPLSSARPATAEDYHTCEEYKEGHIAKPSTDAKHAAAEELREREAALLEELDAQVAAGTLSAEARTAQVQALQLEVTRSVWPNASTYLTADQLDAGVVPYLQVLTPFIRGATTDLNLTLGLALIAFVAIQVFGVAAQGPNYFQKFINLRALGNLGKKPLGAIDFIVGLLEIISELGKIVSLSFRLFGNMFAGGILLAVMSFLVAILLPGIFIGLEVIITTIQAFVFAVLTIVFSAQAMESHHGDEEHHEEAH